MNSKLDLTDEAIREMFERRTRRGTPGDVRGRILATTVSMRQPRRPWSVALRDIAGLASRGRVLALVILATAVLMVGLTAVGSRPATPEPSATPQPSATPGTPEKASFFVRPFTFVIPGNTALKATSMQARLFSFTEGSNDMYGLDADGHVLPGVRGITISSTDQAVTHPCPLVEGGRSRLPVRAEPSAFLDDLRTIAGIGLGESTRTTFDGRSAVAVTVDPRAARCDTEDFHVVPGGLGGFVLLSVPSHLVLTVVDGETVVIQVWAGTEEELRAWLPTAAEFLSSVHFAGQP